MVVLVPIRPIRQQAVPPVVPLLLRLAPLLPHLADLTRPLHQTMNVDHALQLVLANHELVLVRLRPLVVVLDPLHQHLNVVTRETRVQAL